MMSRVSFSKYTGILCVCIGLLALVVSAGKTLGKKTMERVLQHEAEDLARDWASYLVEHDSDLRDYIRRGEMNPQLERFFRVADLTGRVFRYKLFDIQGRLLLDSTSETLTQGGERLGAHHANKTFARELTQRGSLYSEIKTSNEPGKPANYAEVYVPIAGEKKPEAVLELYIDQTDQANVLWSSQAIVAVATGCLLLAGLLLPVGVWYAHVKERTKVADEIRRLAELDDLTGLLKRESFIRCLSHSLSEMGNDGSRVAIFYLDLDRFKCVNDTLGHAAGDQILRQAAARMRSVSRKGDLLCRLGGDEFAVALPGISSRNQIRAYAQRLRDTLGRTYLIAGKECHVPASIGYAIAPEDGRDAEDLLAKADMALYRVKNRGGCDFRPFEAEMAAEQNKRRNIELALAKAVEREEFTLFYQPYVRLDSGDIVGREALLRWNRPGEGLLTPGEFLDAARANGSLARLSEWSFLRACNDAMSWNAPLRVAVNVSAEQFLYHDVSRLVVNALERTGLPPDRLEVEITEQVVLHKTAGIMDQLEAIRELGVGIVLDDFGTGYSSLSYLTKFPYTKIKIDRSFVTDLEHNPLNRDLISMVVNLAKCLDVSVTVEGIETSAQKLFLQQFDGILGQGFLFGRPVEDPEKVFHMENEPAKMAGLQA